MLIISPFNVSYESENDVLSFVPHISNIQTSKTVWVAKTLPLSLFLMPYYYITACLRYVLSLYFNYLFKVI